MTDQNNPPAVTHADIDEVMQSFINQHARDVIELLRLHEENARLQDIVDKQRSALERFMPFDMNIETGKLYGGDRKFQMAILSAKEALSLTATEKEPKE